MSGVVGVPDDVCLKRMQLILDRLESIDDRLFKDNGTVSIQTRLDRVGSVARVAIWLAGLIVLVGVGELAAGLVLVVRHVASLP